MGHQSKDTASTLSLSNPQERAGDGAAPELSQQRVEQVQIRHPQHSISHHHNPYSGNQSIQKSHKLVLNPCFLNPTTYSNLFVQNFDG